MCSLNRLCLLKAVVFITILTATCAFEYRIIETSNGQIRGVRHETLLKNIEFFSFKGIPYAKPPVGDLRFKVGFVLEPKFSVSSNRFEWIQICVIVKVPEPIESWAPNVLDAFEHGHICFQDERFVVQPWPQSEDCLTLNVYIPGRGKRILLFNFLVIRIQFSILKHPQQTSSRTRN